MEIHSRPGHSVSKCYTEAPALALEVLQDVFSERLLRFSLTGGESQVSGTSRSSSRSRCLCVALKRNPQLLHFYFYIFLNTAPALHSISRFIWSCHFRAYKKHSDPLTTDWVSWLDKHKVVCVASVCIYHYSICTVYSLNKKHIHFQSMLASLRSSSSLSYFLIICVWACVLIHVHGTSQTDSATKSVLFLPFHSNSYIYNWTICPDYDNDEQLPTAWITLISCCLAYVKRAVSLSVRSSFLSDVGGGVTFVCIFGSSFRRAWQLSNTDAGFFFKVTETHTVLGAAISENKDWTNLESVLKLAATVEILSLRSSLWGDGS